MGTPLPPNEDGVLCTQCFGPTKAFGPVTTPRYLAASLFGLQPGDFWDAANQSVLLAPHLLEQTLAPCLYRINDGTFTWILQWFAGFTEFNVLRNSDGRSAFFHDDDQGCALALDNEILGPAFVVAFGGSATFSWSTSGLTP